MFDGGDPMADTAIKPLYLENRYFFELFFLIVDRESGDYRRPPTDNSPHEQPYVTMQVMHLLQGLWIEKLKKERDANTTRM